MSTPTRLPAPVAALAVAAVLAVALVACGIPTDDAPRPLADATTTTAPETSPEGAGSTADIYLSRAARPGQLERVERSLDGPPTPGRVLAALLAAPTDEDIEQGFTSLIPTGTTAVGVEVDGDLVSVEMSEEWGSLAGGATDAYAQVVLTLTDLPGIDRVRFLIDGDEIQAPTVNEGNQVIVTAADYAALDPG